MITNLTYKRYINEIGSLFCGNEALCRDAMLSRINQAFDNIIFRDYFLPGLTSKRFFKMGIADIKPGGRLKLNIFWEYTDIITGLNKTFNPGTRDIRNASEAFNSKNKTRIFALANYTSPASGSPVRFKYIKDIDDNMALVEVSGLETYNITWSPSGAGGTGSGTGGQTGSGTGGYTGGGGIITNPPIKQPPKQVPQTEPVKAGLFGNIDVESLILPVGVAVVSALLIKRFS